MDERVTVFGSPHCDWSRRILEDASWRSAGYGPQFGEHPRLVDCTQEEERCDKMQVTSYPTICSRTTCLPGYATIPPRYQTTSLRDWDVAKFVRDECAGNAECYRNPTAPQPTPPPDEAPRPTPPPDEAPFAA